MEDKTLSRYWETVVEIIHDGVMMVDPSGAIVSANRALIDMTGYNRDELLGQPCSILKCSSCNKVFDPTGQHGACSFASVRSPCANARSPPRTAAWFT